MLPALRDWNTRPARGKLTGAAAGQRRRNLRTHATPVVRMLPGAGSGLGGYAECIGIIGLADPSGFVQIGASTGNGD